jgi:hypothetical protein
MTTWDALARECDAWAATGRNATWWWRDDDAVEPTPALETLIALVPDALALAVIPSRTKPELAGFLRQHPGVRALQHGFAHVNHAHAGERKSEFPDSRDVQAAWVELAEGHRMLQSTLGTQALPVLTPPWNRAGDALLAGLHQRGFRGLSRYLPRRAPQIHRLKQVNTHVDVIDWKGSRGFVGETIALTLLIGHFEARRLGNADRDEPTGLLTHHLVHDPATWRFLEKLRDFLKKQPAARLLDPATVFETGAVRVQ